MLPSTAEHKGYHIEKSKGNVKSLLPGEKITFHVRAGLLTACETKIMMKKIIDILKEN